MIVVRIIAYECAIKYKCVICVNLTNFRNNQLIIVFNRSYTIHLAYIQTKQSNEVSRMNGETEPEMNHNVNMEPQAGRTFTRMAYADSYI